MAQRRPHVPKFSDFESADDFPYIPYTQRPRQNKITTFKTKPNNPGKNVEPFMHVKKGKTRENESFPPTSPPNENSENSASVEKRLKNHRRKNSRSTDSGSEKSNPDNFVNKNHGKDNRKKNVVESEYFVPPPTEHRSNSVLCDLSSDSKVPKHRAWDEKDSTSGDGFNVLFNKVKEEKQIAASKFPVAPPRVVTHTVAQKEKKKNKRKRKTSSKKWCCLFPSD